MYLELLEKYRQKYGFKLFSFALMPNQIDLLVELKEGTTISEIMHDINSSYTKYFNGKFNRKGHLFRERFQSIIVEKEPYLLRLVNYIHLRPVILGLAGEQSGYVFSSSPLYLRDITQQEPTAGINLENEIAEASGLLKKIFPEKSYADYIAEITKEELEELSQRLDKSKLLGSNEFVENVKKQIESRKAQTEEEKKVEGHKPQMMPAVLISLAILIPGAIVAVVYIQKNIAAKDKGMVIVKTGPQIITGKETQGEIPLVELNGTTWTIELTPKDKTAASFPAVDKLIFKDGTVVSKYLSANGYPASNYGSSIQDGKLVWETMQRNDSGDVVFWRGEATREGKMAGVVNRRPVKGAAERFSFTSAYYKREE
jgi:REP element-mobilizing transposase RayT